MNYFDIESAKTPSEFKDAVNNARLKFKNKWYFTEAVLNGKEIRIKGYNTWLQICDVAGKYNANVPDQKVAAFKVHLFRVGQRIFDND